MQDGKTEDGDFDASDEDSSDDEATIQEQEKAEKNVDHKQELAQLTVSWELWIVLSS